MASKASKDITSEKFNTKDKAGKSASKQGSIKKDRAEKKKKSTIKYAFNENTTFDVALQYFNRQPELIQIRKKKVKPEKYEYYVEKMDMNNNEKKCKKCKDVLTGVKYFENKNKVKDVLCYFCLCKILKTKVGDNAGRIQEQLRWLDQHKQKSYLSQ